MSTAVGTGIYITIIKIVLCQVDISIKYYIGFFKALTPLLRRFIIKKKSGKIIGKDTNINCLVLKMQVIWSK